MCNYYLALFSLIITFLPYTVYAESNIDPITQSIVNVCKKPSDAGKYWSTEITASGEARLKFIIPRTGASGTITFSESEWEGITNSIKDNADYRECVKYITPLFLEKFSNNKEIVDENDKNKRIIGGVSWEKIGLGVSIKLKSCQKDGQNITCYFTAESLQSDTELVITPRSCIYDQNGNKYISNMATIANTTGYLDPNRYDSVDADLIKNVETPVVISFSGELDNSKVISKALISTYGFLEKSLQ